MLNCFGLSSLHLCIYNVRVYSTPKSCLCHLPYHRSPYLSINWSFNYNYDCTSSMLLLAERNKYLIRFDTYISIHFICIRWFKKQGSKYIFLYVLVDLSLFIETNFMNKLKFNIFFLIKKSPCTFYSEERLVNLIRRRECFVGLSILFVYVVHCKYLFSSRLPECRYSVTTVQGVTSSCCSSCPPYWPCSCSRCPLYWSSSCSSCTPY